VCVESKVARGGACKLHICNGMDGFVVARGTKVVDMFIGATRKEVETSVLLLEVTKVTLKRNIIIKCFVFMIVTHTTTMAKFKSLHDLSI
jgi:hypothetical protein